MDYNAFKEFVVENIKELLPEEYADCDVRLSSVPKNNEILDGLTITSPETNVSPTIYLNSFYDELENGRPLEAIMQKIANTRIEKEVSQIFDVSKITEYEYVKDKIYCRLIGAEKNDVMLNERPHTLIGDDLAVTYHINLGESEEKGMMSVPISNELLNHYSLDVKQLHYLAMQNMPILSPASFKSMNEVMMEMMLPQMAQDLGGDLEAAKEMLSSMIPEDDKMFVLTNVSKLNGAACMLDTAQMDNIRDRVGDYYILPSSIHEVLIVPQSAGMELYELEAMVQEVNETQVAPQDRLSDHVYAYDPVIKEIYRADLEEEHRAKVDEMSQNSTRKQTGR